MSIWLCLFSLRFLLVELDLVCLFVYRPIVPFSLKIFEFFNYQKKKKKEKWEE